MVGGGALVLGVPKVGTIALITFLGAYIPYLGAWGAGAFAVLISLGGAGTDAAIGMIIIQLLANGLLQQLVQPVAYGAALGIHPLAVLVVTIAGGALFGAAGLILAAPIVSAVNRITADLRGERAAEGLVDPPPDARRRPGAGELSGRSWPPRHTRRSGSSVWTTSPSSSTSSARSSPPPPASAGSGARRPVRTRSGPSTSCIPRSSSSTSACRTWTGSRPRDASAIGIRTSSWCSSRWS